MRSVDTRFWSDGWVRKLNALDRYVFLYLLTNEHTNWCGIYEVDISMIAFETGIDERDLTNAVLPRLSPKIIYVDGWVYVPNFAKYHLNSTSDTKKGYDKAFEAVPARIRLKITAIQQKGVVPPTPPSFASASAFTSASITAAPAAEQIDDEYVREPLDDNGDPIPPRSKRKPKDQNAQLTLDEAYRKYGYRSATSVRDKTHIAAMHKAGFTDEEIFAEFDRLQQDPYWGDKKLNFGIVHSQIGGIKPQRPDVSDFSSNHD